MEKKDKDGNDKTIEVEKVRVINNTDPPLEKRSPQIVPMKIIKTSIASFIQ